jgi:hypothetical protein
VPISSDGILQVEFDPAWAAVRVIVDGGMWPSGAAVDAVTVTRIVAGEADMPVRGILKTPAVGGYFVGSDIEMDLESTVTYQAAGYANGVLQANSAQVTVSTTGAAPGIWVKVPGQPDLTQHARFRAMSEMTSDTVGGIYQIVGGSSVAQTTAQWSGVDTEKGTLELATAAVVDTASMRVTLNAGRVLLLQPVGSTDLDQGYYFVSSVARENPAGIESYFRRRFSLSVQRTGMPAGNGQGIPGVTWNQVMATFPTWQDVIDAHATWFDLLQGV